MRGGALYIWILHAALVELEDTMAPGAIARESVGVRIPRAALSEL